MMLKLTPGDLVRIGDCPVCGLDLHQVTLYGMGESGPRPMFEVRICERCGRWPGERDR